MAGALEIFGTYDRGVPNLERIVLRANQPLKLSPYCLLIGFHVEGKALFPIPDQFLWLGSLQLEVPSWIFVYTGPGEPGISQEAHTKDPVHTIYWGKESVLFGNPEIVPGLIRVESVEIDNKPPRSVQELIKKAEEPTTDLAQLLAYLATNPSPPK